MRIVTVYPNTFGTNEFQQETRSEVTLETVGSYIADGRNGLDVKTQRAQRLAEGDESVYATYKTTQLPAAVFSGTFSRIPATNNSLVQHSALVVIDYDNVEDTGSIVAELSNLPEVRLAFVSPSGKGVKAVVEVTPVPKNATEHKFAWHAVVEHLSQIEGVNEDESGKDLRRMCYLAHDPLVYMRVSGPAVAWEAFDLLTEAPPKQKDFDGVVDLSLLEHLDADDYQSWLEVGMACHASGVHFGVWEEWSKRSKKFSAGECLKKWNTFSEKPTGVTWGSIVHKATKAKQSVEDTPEDEERSIFNKNGTFQPMAMMHHLNEEGLHFVTLPTDKKARIYQDGVYRIDWGSTIEKAVMNTIGISTQTRHMNATRTTIEHSSMIDMPPKGLQPCLHTDALNLENGVLNLKTRELTKHSPSDVWIHKLPVTYNPEAKCPEFDLWLHEVQEGRLADIQLAHEIIGLCMLQFVPFPQIYALYGPTHTGKSTFLDVVTSLVGEENISDVAFHELGGKDDKFASASLVGSLANIDRDVTITKIEDAGLIKKIAGGELISVQAKGKDRVSLRPYATMLMATNDSLQSGDFSDGWYKRLTVLNFQKQHLDPSQVKRDQVAKMTTPAELSGILNHALAGIARLMETGHHTHSESVVDNRVKFEERNNLVLRWFNENFQVDSHAFEAAELEKHFTDWCGDEGVRTPAKRILRETLEKMGIKRKRPQQTNGERFFVYEGIAHKENATEEDSTTADEVPF